ncbi:MAG: hypothetical protein MUC96_01865 [Myxococcaceae bacterium]|jgi:hypothetical protein|nr:hypothetical protein [Myxococcaceae bacterium]
MGAPLWLSTLNRQKLMLGDFFLRRWPHDWLVWLSGGGQFAPTVEARDLDETLQPGAAAPRALVSSDCQAFSLEWAGTPLSVGRAGVNDFVINDVTVPRVAGLLVFRGGAWNWRRLGSEVDEQLGPYLPLLLGTVELRLVPAEVMDRALERGACEALLQHLPHERQRP